LVEGHTASTGNPGGEMQLSIQRARRIISELIKRGISGDRFIYIGWGGTRPIGDNTTDAGRSLNRRVEITILE
jgi:outer membrane protein OmpA-like peptidoglycan-associated protein